MRITDIFDAVRDGTYFDFMDFYSGNPNLFNKYAGMSLLQLSVLSPKDQRNALHIFYFSVLRPEPQYMLKITQLLIAAGVDINKKDKYGAIPLQYAITAVKLPTKTIMPVYQYLMDRGSNICEKDNFGKTCLDYAEEFSWRNDLIHLLEGNNIF